MHQKCTTPHPRYGKTPDFSGVSMAATLRDGWNDSLWARIAQLLSDVPEN